MRPRSLAAASLIISSAAVFGQGLAGPRPTAQSLSPAPAETRAQLVQLLTGQAGGRLGTSTATWQEGDLHTMLVGQPEADGGRGAVEVYERGAFDLQWTHRTTLHPPDAQPGDHFGQAVAITADTIVVGAPGRDGAGVDQGAIYVFRKESGIWMPGDTLTASGGAAGDQFGSSVAASGTHVVAGAPFDDLPGGPDGGSVHAFRQSGGVWTEQILNAVPAWGGQRFGYAVAMAGDTLAAGVPRADGAVDFQGQVCLYTYSGGSWQPLASNPLANGSLQAYFGTSLAISPDGRLLVVGAPGHAFDGTHPNAGAAYVYDLFSGAPVLQSLVSLESPVNGQRLGTSVAVNDWTIVAGGPGEQQVPGLAAVFAYDTGSWYRTDVIPNPGSSESASMFGSSVSKSGTQTLVGAPVETVDDTWGSGTVAVFENGPHVWRISPTSGPAAGGTAVTFYGMDFSQVPTAVTFGTETSPSVQVINGRTLVAEAPQHVPGTVDVTVEHEDRPPFTLPGAYTYLPAQNIVSVMPNVGPRAGGYDVEIRLRIANETTEAYFGQAQALIQVLLEEAIRVKAPIFEDTQRPRPGAAASPIDIRVVTDGAESVLEDAYTYADIDLLVTALTGPAAVGPGEALTVTDKTKNLGPDSSPPSVTELYLSQDAALDAGDVRLGARDVPALAPRKLDAGATVLNIPANQPAGPYWLIARADGPGAAVEARETNNVRVKPLRVGADLTIRTLSAPASVTRGVAFTVTAVTKNAGPGGALGTTSRLLLSADAVADVDDLVLVEWPLGPLGARASDRHVLPVTLAPEHPAGTFYLIAVADVGGAVPESNEANNGRAKRLVVK